MALEVLYEDNHLLAVSKPAGLPTMGVRAGAASLLKEAKEYLRRKYRKPGNVYLGTVSRLDTPVTGVVLFARTSKAARRLAEQFRGRTVEKCYWALVAQRIWPAEGRLVDWLVRHERGRKVLVADRGGAGAQQAVLHYRLVGPVRQWWLLEIRLETGRKHQIRVQLAHHGQPIVGDFKYGSRQPFAAGIALHARRLTFTHPISGQRIALVAPLPACWRKLGVKEQG